jgi:hypothetical protein
MTVVRLNKKINNRRDGRVGCQYNHQGKNYFLLFKVSVFTTFHMTISQKGIKNRDIFLFSKKFQTIYSRKQKLRLRRALFPFRWNIILPPCHSLFLYHKFQHLTIVHFFLNILILGQRERHPYCSHPLKVQEFYKNIWNGFIEKSTNSMSYHEQTYKGEKLDAMQLSHQMLQIFSLSNFNSWEQFHNSLK